MAEVAIPPEVLLSNRTNLNFLRPQDATYDIYTIAAGLSKVCRWGAQCDDFYSVAQHSVLVSMVVPRELALWGLLHDASEGLMGLDMTSPLKQLCPEFKVIERRVQADVFDRFAVFLGLNWANERADTGARTVKAADLKVEATEWRDIMHGANDGSNRAARLGVDPLRDLRIEPWDHRKARRMFLTRYAKIIGAERDPQACVELAKMHAMVR